MAKCIMAKYLGATDTKGSRIRAYTCERSNGSYTRGFHDTDGKRSPEDVAAGTLAERLGWTGVWVRGTISDGVMAYTCLGSLPKSAVTALAECRELAFEVKRAGVDSVITLYPTRGAL